MFRACVGLLGLTVACSGAPSDSVDTGPDSVGAVQTAEIRVQEVVQGLTRPVELLSPAGDRRLFVVEQPGRIRIVDDGRLVAAPFLDITSKVRSSGNEQGLLGLAFHPSYATNGFLYVNYTDLQGDTQVERYTVGPDRNRADPASAKRILSIDQPFANHNGGQLLFGEDGMLYIPTGDGGSGGDPQGNGQNLNTLLGKILRIDVDRGDPYGIPADNPFVSRAGARREIWAYGVRNPWRIDFDRGTNLGYVADVGQTQWEEVHVAPMSQGGINYGWNRMEGTHCFRDGCDRSGLHLPQVEYEHPEGCSIAGGDVYRGRAIPALNGHYFYGDYCQGWVRSFRFAGGAVTDRRSWSLGSLGQILAFGEDSEGELYILSMNGRVYKIIPA